MQLHQRGVDLLVDVMDAADHVEKFSHDDVRRILKEVADVLGELLKRDIPEEHRPPDQPEQAGIVSRTKGEIDDALAIVAETYKIAQSNAFDAAIEARLIEIEKRLRRLKESLG